MVAIIDYGWEGFPGPALGSDFGEEKSLELREREGRQGALIYISLCLGAYATLCLEIMLACPDVGELLVPWLCRAVGGPQL